jgi:aerobic C4-dicarboxylate transport protein
MPPQVPLPLVKALRDELGISMKDAKDALLKANLDLDLARSILKGEVPATPPPAPSASNSQLEPLPQPLPQALPQGGRPSTQ